MIKLLFFFLFSFTLYAKTFSVASYNVENLFDLKYDKTEYAEFIPSKTNWNRQIQDIKLSRIAQVLNEVNADIVALQEVESQDVLKALLKKTPQYAYYNFVKNPYSAVGVAIISKYPIKEQKALPIQSKEKIERPIQKVTIEIQPNKTITIFNNHWRSKRAAESKRIAYAMSLQKYLETLDESSDYILLGDFNSNYDEYLTFKHNKELNDSYNITGINQVLNTTIEQQYVLKENINQYQQKVHYNLWLELPYHKRYSYIYKNEHNTPDNIILSKGLFDDKNISYVNNSFKQFSPKYLIQNNKINRWEIKNKMHKGIGYSDHLPILAYFSTSPYEKETRQTTQKSTSFLYEIENLESPFILKNMIVLYKEGNNAILKEKNDRAIYAYNCAKELKEGFTYDIEIRQLHMHYGLKEVIELNITNKYPNKENPKNYYLDARTIDLFDLQYQNELITQLTGIYENGYLHISSSSKKIKLYSKDKSLLPKNGQNITIMSGHLGYYKSNVQIILYKKSDIRVN